MTLRKRVIHLELALEIKNDIAYLRGAVIDLRKQVDSIKEYLKVETKQYTLIERDS